MTDTRRHRIFKHFGGTCSIGWRVPCHGRPCTGRHQASGAVLKRIPWQSCWASDTGTNTNATTKSERCDREQLLRDPTPGSRSGDTTKFRRQHVFVPSGC